MIAETMEERAEGNTGGMSLPVESVVSSVQRERLVRSRQHTPVSRWR